MRGSIDFQVRTLLSSVNAIGKSKKLAKERARQSGAKTWHDIGKSLDIHSYNTMKTYSDVWRDILWYIKENYGIKDAEKITGQHIQAYLKMKVSQKIKYATFQKYAAASEKLAVALTKFSKQVGKNNSYDFSKDIARVRKEAQKVLERFEGRRHYKNPEKLVNAIANENYRLAAKVQFEGGARFSEVAKLKPFSFKGLSNGKGYIEVKGKGGKIRTITVSENTYKSLYEKVSTDNWSLSKGPYLRSLKLASQLTNQPYQGSHGLRWNYALRSFLDKQARGIDYFRAIQEVSHELGHNRPDITERYLFGVRR